MRHIALLALACTVAGCATVAMPGNVTTRAYPGSNSQMIDTVDLSYPSQAPPSFAKLKLCVASNISNTAVTLSDHAGSFIGPATGNYYQTGSGHDVGGGPAIKYVDDAAQTIIANGTTDAGPAAGGLTRVIMRFQLEAARKNKGVSLKFDHIEEAQKSTGVSVNDGFYPVGTFSGAHPLQVLDALNGIAGEIRQCANA